MLLFLAAPYQLLPPSPLLQVRPLNVLRFTSSLAKSFICETMSKGQNQQVLTLAHVDFNPAGRCPDCALNGLEGLGTEIAISSELADRQPHMVSSINHMDMGDCQNYGPFLGPYYNTGPNTGPNLGDPKRDHNFDNPPHTKVIPTPFTRTPDY